MSASSTEHVIRCLAETFRPMLIDGMLPDKRWGPCWHKKMLKLAHHPMGARNRESVLEFHSRRQEFGEEKM